MSKRDTPWRAVTLPFRPVSPAELRDAMGTYVHHYVLQSQILEVPSVIPKRTFSDIIQSPSPAQPKTPPKTDILQEFVQQHVSEDVSLGEDESKWIFPSQEGLENPHKLRKHQYVSFVGRAHDNLPVFTVGKIATFFGDQAIVEIIAQQDPENQVGQMNQKSVHQN
jgi:hypothetical protein